MSCHILEFIWTPNTALLTWGLVPKLIFIPITVDVNVLASSVFTFFIWIIVPIIVNSDHSSLGGSSLECWIKAVDLSHSWSFCKMLDIIQSLSYRIFFLPFFLAGRFAAIRAEAWHWGLILLLVLNDLVSFEARSFCTFPFHEYFSTF